MAEDRRLSGTSLTVDGSPLPVELYDLLTLVRVEESVQLPDSFTIRFDDPYFVLFDSGRFAIGTRVEIAFQAEGDLTTVTVGEVTAMAVEQAPGGRHEMVLTGMDASHRLARGPKSRSFQQMTIADIVSKVADEYGLDSDVVGTSEVQDYVLQASQTDYAFLAGLGRRIGYDLWVADETLHFAARPGAAAAPPMLRWGDNLHRFKVRLSSSEHCDEITVRGWDPIGKRTLIGRATEGDPGSTAAAGAQVGVQAGRGFGPVRRFAGHFPVTTQTAADALAGSLLLRSSGDELIARGEATGDPLLAAGAQVLVEGMGERLSGEYLLTSVEHVFGGGTPYVTRFVCGGKDPASLTDLIGGAAGAVGRGGGGWGGIVVGLVTNSDDGERLGRVRVKFPTLTDDDESTWARISCPGAGPDRGFQCIPEVGDEVLVAFEHGDTCRPVVLGGLWNQQDPPPDADAVSGGSVQARTWTSRVGHQVQLRDGPESEITLAMGDADSKLVLAMARSSLTGQRSLQLHGQDVEIRASTKLTLQAPSIEIIGDSQVKVSGGVIRLN